MPTFVRDARVEVRAEGVGTRSLGSTETDSVNGQQIWKAPAQWTHCV